MIDMKCQILIIAIKRQIFKFILTLACKANWNSERRLSELEENGSAKEVGDCYDSVEIFNIIGDH